MTPMIEKFRKMQADHIGLIKELQFFDSNVWLGKPVGFPLSKELKAENIRDACEKHYITGALISHWMGASVSAQDSNEALCKIAPKLSDSDYLIWTALPLYPKDSGHLPGCNELHAKVRAVRISPKTHGFTSEF